MIKPLTFTILTAATISGCDTNTRTIDEIVDPFDGPSPTIHIPANVATKEYDGSKGKFPPGRTINYQGHVVEYTTGNVHINHHIHKHTHHGHGGLGYHNY